MTRRLFYMNAVLLLMILLLGFRLRTLWLDAREQEAMVQLNSAQRLKYPGQAPSPPLATAPTRLRVPPASQTLQ